MLLVCFIAPEQNYMMLGMSIENENVQVGDIIYYITHSHDQEV